MPADVYSLKGTKEAYSAKGGCQRVTHNIYIYISI